MTTCRQLNLSPAANKVKTGSVKTELIQSDLGCTLGWVKPDTPISIPFPWLQKGSGWFRWVQLHRKDLKSDVKTHIFKIESNSTRKINKEFFIETRRTVKLEQIKARLSDLSSNYWCAYVILNSGFPSLSPPSNYTFYCFVPRKRKITGKSKARWNMNRKCLPRGWMGKGRSWDALQAGALSAWICQTSCQPPSLPRSSANLRCDFVPPRTNPQCREAAPFSQPWLEEEEDCRALAEIEVLSRDHLALGLCCICRLQCQLVTNDSVVSPVLLALRIEQLHFSASTKSPWAYDITKGNPSFLHCTAKELLYCSICRTRTCSQSRPPRLPDTMRYPALQKGAAIQTFV